MHTADRIELQRARDFGETIDVSFTFLRENFKSLGKCLLYIVGPFILAVAIVSASLPLGFDANTSDSDVGIYSLVTIFILLPAYVAISTFIQIVPIHFMLLYSNDGKDNFEVREVWRESSQDFWMIFVTNLAVGIILVIGFMFCILPGIYLAVVLSLVPVIRINEGLSLGSAMSRSNNLIAGNWWFSLGLYIILLIIIYIFNLILQLPTIIVTSLGMLHSTTPGQVSIAVKIWSYIGTIIGSLAYFISAIIYIVITFHYFSLVEKKEAAGLAGRIEEIASVDEDD